MQYYLKQLFNLALILFTSALVAQESQEFKIPLKEVGKKGLLDVELHKGPITVKGTTRKDVLIRYKPLGDSSVKITDAGNGLKKISGGLPSLDISADGNEVKIESSSWGKGVDIYVEVPADFDLELSAHMESTVSVENVKGEMVIENHNGPIHAKNIAGSLIANSYNGEIIATFDSVTPDAPMALTTYNGNVDITFPSNVKASFKLRTENGDIYTGFDMETAPAKLTKQHSDDDDDDKHYSLGGWIEGSINGGGAEMKLRTYQGDIYIRKK